jgi:TolA-binding protein
MVSTFLNPARPLADRRWVAGAACLLAALLGSGCGSVGKSDTVLLSKDMYEIQTKLDKYMGQQESLERQVKFALNSIDETVQSRGELTRTTLDDMEKRMREQLDEIRALRSQVETLNFAIDALSKRLAMGGGALPAGNPGAEGMTASNANVDSLLSSGQRQINLQNYAAARDDLLKAMDQKPTGDQMAETLFWLAESYFYLNDMDNARKYYNQMMHDFEQHPKAWLSVERVGDSYLRQGKNDEALQVFQMIVNTYPGYPNVARVQANIERIQPAGGATTPGIPPPH